MWLSIAVSVLLGFLSGLGTGGGSLLILWLTLCAGLPQDQARVVNLLFFIPSALVACLFRWKQGRLHLKTLLPAILVGSATAALFTFLSIHWDTGLLRKLFGGLLVITAIRELCYKQKKASP